MKTYEVTLPVTGVCYLTVEADSPEAAIDKAMDEVKSEHLETWQTHKRICEGNILYAEVNEALAEEVT